MKTGLFSHSACFGHETPPGHPESVDRLRAIMHALEGVSGLAREEAPAANCDALLRAHDEALVERVLVTLNEEAAREHFVRVDADTVMSAGSGEAALRAAGAAIAAVDAVMAGRTSRTPSARCARPATMPSPTARWAFASSTTSPWARLHAREVHGLQRIAVVDFDVHHGNGTQDFFWNDADLFYASTHQSPLYPGTGRAVRDGCRAAISSNVPLPAGFGQRSLPRGIRSASCCPRSIPFAPDFIFISAGFDAHRADPLAAASAQRRRLRLGDARNLCAGSKALSGPRCFDSGRRL